MGKDGIWTRAVKKIHCQFRSVPYQAGPAFKMRKGIWTLARKNCTLTCVSAVSTTLHSSVLHWENCQGKKRKHVKVPNLENHRQYETTTCLGSSCRACLSSNQPYFSFFGIIDSINTKGVRFARNHRQGLGWLPLCVSQTTLWTRGSVFRKKDRLLMWGIRLGFRLKKIQKNILVLSSKK